MHTEHDTLTRDRAIRVWTGHSRRYLLTRNVIRATWMVAAWPVAYLISITH